MSLSTEFERAMKLIKALIIISTLPLTCKVQAETQFTNEFWISTSTNTANSGTLNDPFDGSTASKFDDQLFLLPEHSTLHILAGHYETYGNGVYFLKNGQKLLGSGIDVTVLKLASNAVDNASVLANGGVATNIEICDLTVDANYSSGLYTFHGVNLHGTRHAIRRVKAINCAHYSTNNSDSFPIGIAATYGSIGVNSDGNIIEDCEVSRCSGGAVSAIGMNGGPTNSISGIIRNNRVFFPPTNSLSSNFGINCTYAYDVLVEGNYVDGAGTSCYGDTGFHKNMMVVHNTFRNCFYGVFLQGTARENLTFAFNTVSLKTNAFEFNATAFDFYGNGSYTNVVVTGNDVGFHNGQPQTNTYCYFLVAQGVTGLIVDKNRVDPLLRWDSDSSTGVKIFDNFDRKGNYVGAYNQVEPPNSTVRTTATNNYIVSYTDRHISVTNTSSTTIYLPSPVGWAGKEFVIAKEISTRNIVTLNVTSPPKINGTQTVKFNAPYGSKTVISDGANWFAR